MRRRPWSPGADGPSPSPETPCPTRLVFGSSQLQLNFSGYVYSVAVHLLLSGSPTTLPPHFSHLLYHLSESRLALEYCVAQALTLTAPTERKLNASVNKTLCFSLTPILRAVSGPGVQWCCTSMSVDSTAQQLANTTDIACLGVVSCSLCLPSVFLTAVSFSPHDSAFAVGC